MRSRAIAALFCAALLAGTAFAQVPRERLLQPPADAQSFVIVSAAGQHGTASLWRMPADPTLATFESLYVPENGDLSPSYASFVGTMPPATERGFRAGGFKPPEGVTRADYGRAGRR